MKNFLCWYRIKLLSVECEHSFCRMEQIKLQDKKPFKLEQSDYIKGLEDNLNQFRSQWFLSIKEKERILASVNSEKWLTEEELKNIKDFWDCRLGVARKLASMAMVSLSIRG